MGCIGQQIVVIADLNIRLHRIPQILLIAAILAQEAIRRTGLRHTNTATVKAGKIWNVVQIQNVVCHAQAFALVLASGICLHLSPQQAGVAGKAFFSFSHNCCKLLMQDDAFLVRCGVETLDVKYGDGGTYTMSNSQYATIKKSDFWYGIENYNYFA